MTYRKVINSCKSKNSITVDVIQLFVHLISYCILISKIKRSSHDGYITNIKL